VLIMIYGDHCGNCVAMYPKFVKAAKAFDKLKFEHVITVAKIQYQELGMEGFMSTGKSTTWPVVKLFPPFKTKALFECVFL
jgi:thiol-disulfide isomerase/thioredoxin